MCARSAPAISAPPMCCAPARNGRRRRRLLCDGAKGAAAVLLARHFLPPGCGNLRRTWRGPRPSLSRLAALQGRQGRRHLSGHLPCALLAGGRAGGCHLVVARLSSGASHRSSALIAIALSSAYFLLFGSMRAYAALALLLSLLIYLHAPRQHPPAACAARNRASEPRAVPRHHA